jgi:hypothetical protein
LGDRWTFGTQNLAPQAIMLTACGADPRVRQAIRSPKRQLTGV